MTFANSLNPDQPRQNSQPVLDPNAIFFLKMLLEKFADDNIKQFIHLQCIQHVKGFKHV